MNNYSNMSFDQTTKKSLFGYKAWVRIALIISMVADLFTLLYLAVLSGSFWYSLIPLLLFLASAGILVLSVFAIDYRYAYSIWFAVGYSILQTAGVIGLIYHTGVNVDVTMSTTAYLIYATLHIGAVVVYNVVAYTTNKLDKNSTRVGAVLISIASIISVASIVYTCAFGFFGQGIGLFDNEMVLVYEKNEDDTYGVKDILYGRGDTIVIPESFDGKEITGISAEIFTKRVIKKIVVENKKNLKVNDLDKLENDLSNIPQIRVNIDQIDYYREILFDASIQQNSKTAMALCNEITYISCPEDKVVVSFNYNFDNLPQISKNKLFPTTILDKGSKLDLESYFSDIPYISFIDADTEAKMYDAYYKGQGYYLVSPEIEEGHLLNGSVIDTSVEVLPLVFERVFLIDVTCGNDTKYQVPNELSATVKDTDTGKLVKENQLSSYIASINSLVKREGFDVEYKVNGKQLSVDNLLSDLQDKNSTKIVPNWTIHTPKITDVVGNKSYTYGDELLSLTINAESVHKLKYELIENSNLTANGNVFTKSRPTPTDSATYTFRVYIDDEKTSLSAEATREVVVSVVKKKIEASWTIPENAVYNESPYTAYASIPNGSMAFEDSSSVITNIFDNEGNKVINPTNAGIYRMQVEFADSDLDRLYTIIHSTEELEIARCRVDAQWSNTSLIYTGKQNLPSVLVNGISGVLSTKVIGESIDAGSYTARVEFVNDIDKLNYTISNILQDYTISAKVINAVWSSSTLEYNDQEQSPTISSFESNSLCENDILDLSEIKYNGKQKNAGTGYTVTITENFKNYDISSTTSSCEYQITKAPLTVRVENKVVDYDGARFDDTFAVTTEGLLGNDTLSSVISQLYFGDEIANAENASTYTIVLSAKQQGADYNNYTITFEQGKTLKINQAEAIVKWGGTSLVYNSQVQHPSVSVVGVNQISLEYNLTGAQTNAGTDYKAEISLVSSLDKQNYYINIDKQSVEYAISKKPLTIKAEDKSKTYDARVYTGFTYIYSDIGVNDTLDQIVTSIGYNAETTGAIDAGKYDIELTIAKNSEKSNNYEITLEKGQLTINKATAEVNYVGNSFVFDNTKKLPTITVTGVMLDGGAREAVSFNAYTRKNGQSADAISVGAYTVELELTNDNYKLPTYSISFEITPSTARVEWGNTSFTYTGEAQLPSVTIKGVGDLPVDFTISTSDGQNAIKRGDYTAKITLNDSNYVLDSYTKSFVINPYVADIAWLATEVEYNGEPQLPTSIIKGVNGEIIFSFTIDTVDGQDAIDAGDYEVAVTLSNNNYVLSNYTTSFKIVQRAVSPVIKNTTLTYNGKSQLPSFLFVGVNGGTLEYSASTDNGQDAIDVGDYLAKVTFKNSNYVLSEDTIGFSIVQRTISPESKNTTLTYNGKAQLPSLVFKGVEGETLEYSIVTDDGQNAIDVGDYLAVVTLSNGNYKLEDNEIDFKIERAKLTVEWGNATHTYNGEEFAPQVTLKGVENAIIDAEVFGAEANVGTDYIATVSIKNAQDQANYYIEETDVSISFSILPFQATVSWDYKDPYTYCGTAQKPTVTVNGVANALLDVTVEYMLSDKSSATESINAGTYVAVITLSDTNYTVKASEKELIYVINKKDLIISANDLTVDYTGESFNESLTYKHEGLVDGEDLSDIVTVTISGEAIDKTDVGTYTIEPSIEPVSNQNYNITLVNGTLTIQEVVSVPDQE